MKKVNIYLGILLFLGTLNTTILNKNLIWWGMSLFLILLYFFKKIKNIEFLFLSMLIPSKLIQFLSLFIYVFINFKKIFHINFKYKEILIFLYYILFVGMINCIFNNGSFLNVILQFGIYLIYMLVIIQFENSDIDYDYFVKFLKYVFWIEAIISMIQILYFRLIGDFVKGTFISANYLGVYILITLFLIYKKENNIKIFLYKDKFIILMAIFLLYISDVKHIYGSFILALIFYWILKSIFKGNLQKYIVVFAGILILIGTISCVKLVKVNAVRNIIYKVSADNAQYIYRQGLNQKYVYFNRTIDNLSSYKDIIGIGVGQYGSQIANFRAYDTIYKINGENNKIFKAYTNPIYYKGINGLMTETYVNNIKNMSMV
ncbi:hypothetical protein C4D47_11445, partial [Clostridium perfringens]